MRSMTEQQQDGWTRIRARGQLRFVLIVAVIWFSVFGLLPLSTFLGHASVLHILPVLLGIALVTGLLVGDVAWHFLECGYLERVVGIVGKSLERRRRILSRMVLLAGVAPALSLLIGGTTQPGIRAIAVGATCLLVILVGVLIAFEQSMRRIG